MFPRRKKRNPDSDRRRWPRLEPSAVPFLKAVTLSQGTEVQAIDISRGGMLLETEVRLRPMTKIFLKLVTSEGVIGMKGLVVRSEISSLTGVPKYKSAIEFETPFHMLDNISQEPAIESSATLPPPSLDSPQANELPPFTPLLGEFNEDSSVLTFLTPDTPIASLRDRLKVNDW